MAMNEKLRSYAKQNGVFLWEVAEARGVSEWTLSRYLRRPFSEECANEFCAIVDRIAKGRS